MSVETLLVEQEIGAQVRSLVQLLEQYSADFVWGERAVSLLTRQQPEVTASAPSVPLLEAQPSATPFAPVVRKCRSQNPSKVRKLWPPPLP